MYIHFQFVLFNRCKKQPLKGYCDTWILGSVSVLKVTPAVKSELLSLHVTVPDVVQRPFISYKYVMILITVNHMVESTNATAIFCTMQV